MDVGRLLLGRPWQSDHYTLHDGFRNTFSFTFEGWKITLKSLKNQPNLPFVPSNNNSTLLINRSYLEQCITQNGQFYALVCKLVERDSLNSVPADLVPLLAEFKDVFPSEIPIGLPPFRGIEHYIDLMPGSSLSNRPVYRCKPNESKELQRQVEDLIAKGLVRESMSPCTVYALLVPEKDGTLRMHMVDSVVNRITIKYRHPIPSLDDMLDELYGFRVFSKIDWKSEYHQIRIHDGDEWKTAFRTRLSLFDCLVMPFGISNE